MESKGKRGIYPKNYIKELREAKGLTLRDLEKMTGWSNQTLSNLELSKADLTRTKINKLVDVFQCHPSDITDGPGHSAAAITEKEKELLNKFRGLSDQAKEIYFHMVSTFPDEPEPPKIENDPKNKIDLIEKKK